MRLWPTDGLETPMILAKPAPCVRAVIEAVDEAMRHDHPRHGLAVMQRTGLAFCGTAVRVTNSMCGTRLARASLGPYALAALSWRLRPRKMPWDSLVVASVRGILRHPGLTSGSLGLDATAHPRSQAAKTRAPLYTLRDKASGGYLWGPSLVCLFLVPPKISLPVGFVCYQPAPARSAWYQRAKALKQQKAPPAPRPPQPAPHPP